MASFQKDGGWILVMQTLESEEKVLIGVNLQNSNKKMVNSPGSCRIMSKNEISEKCFRS